MELTRMPTWLIPVKDSIADPWRHVLDVLEKLGAVRAATSRGERLTKLESSLAEARLTRRREERIKH